MAENLLKLQKINKVYGVEVQNQVLFDIDLEIPQGQFLALIGPSGSGKSTLMNILGALDRANSGDIIIDGQPLNGLNENQLADFRNRIMGFIFQFHYLFPDFTALENILIPAQIYSGISVQPAVRARAIELLQRVGLGDKAEAKIRNLSGGQQQRVAIARALINTPKLVLADEPTGSLDTKTSEQIMQLLQEINREIGTTFVIVTHDRKIAAQADRIVELVDGRIYHNYLPGELGQAKAWEDLKAYSCIDCAE